ncbi:MAG: sigma-54 dependent transcriptional regulator [Gammaproteobacteria bacterium]|nr:sigma-54 dependent transcriptional regulator [Gammaproteobacteria bacterium]
MTSIPVLLVEDDLALREALVETLSLGGYDVRVATDGRAALEALRDNPVAAVVTDYQMKPMDGFELLQRLRADYPQLPVLLMTAYGTIQHAVKSMLEGATDYLVKPFSAQVLIDKLARLLPEESGEQTLITEDPNMRHLLDLARRVAPGDSTVLLTGESGTGKEVFARYIHTHSGRALKPFVAINCAAIPENMLEAVLFGHEKGAFTGAHEAKAGKFEQAQGGTLLLDEISEMDLSLQAKLLRVIQEKEVERIGGKRSISLDVRLLATTNRDLRGQVQAGKFREDLFYRLSVFPIELPPLRQRTRDITPLARHFVRECCGPTQQAPTLNDEAVTTLLRHSWPGNVRELQNVVQRAMILYSGHQIRARDLHFDGGPVAAPPRDDGNATGSDAGLQENLQSIEGQLILDALDQGHGSRKRAAEILGISPRTLRYKIARLRDAGIDIPGHRETAAA